MQKGPPDGQKIRLIRSMEKYNMGCGKKKVHLRPLWQKKGERFQKN